MRLTCLLTVLLLTTGCASALKRDAQCLASLTSDYLETQAEAARLEGAWHAALATPQVVEGAGLRVSDPAAAYEDPPGRRLAAARSPSRHLVSGVPGPSTRQVIEAARMRFLTARGRMVQVQTWYDRVYRRVQMRMEERQILSESFLVLAGGGLGALAFYPVVWWNVHSVFWDGIDPDQEADPVTRFCLDRLGQESRDVPGAVSRPEPRRVVHQATEPH